MTSPLIPSLPHMPLGNVATDISGAASNFAKGLIDERQRRQTLAMQQAMQAATMKHLGAESDYLAAETTRIPSEIQQNLAQAKDVGAKGDISLHDNEPAGPGEVLRLRNIHGYEKVPDNFFEGANKAAAESFIDTALKGAAAIESANLRVSTTLDRPFPMYDINTGAAAFAYPHGGPGGTPSVAPVPGNYGKQPTGAERAMAGAGGTANRDHSILTRLEHVGGPPMMNEIAKIISLPNVGRLLPFSSGDAAERILQQFRLMGASPEAQEYVKAMFDFAGTVGPKRYGLRGMQSTLTLQQLWTDFGAGQFGLRPEGIEQAQRNREGAILQFETAAGPTAWQQGQQVFGREPIDTSKIAPAPKTSRYGYQMR